MTYPAGSQRKISAALFPAVALACAAGIFVVDIRTPPQIVVSGLYIGVVLIAASFSQPRGIVLVASACIGLTALASLLDGEHSITALSNIVVIGVATLLTLQRKSANAVLHEQARLLDLTHDTIFMRGMDHVITYWNRGAEELYGWTKEEAVGKVSHQLLQKTFSAPLEDIVAELVRTGRWEGEIVCTKRDGTQVTVASRWSLERDKQGRPATILETNNDITERKRAEEDLLYHIRFLTTVTDNAWSALYFVDPMGRATFVNPSLERMTGYAAQELLGQLIHNKIHHTKPDGTPFPISECQLSGAARQVHVVKGEDMFVRKDGTFLQVRYAASPILRDGVPVGTVVELQDLTERKEAEQALHQARTELAHVARVMSMGELTASIAHEVNQPLAAVVANSSACLRWLAADPPNLDEARSCLQRMIRDSRRAAEVITRVRSLVRKSSSVKIRFDLNDAIEEVLAIIVPEARHYRILMRTDLAPGLPQVRGDRVQLQQVVLNLVMNGIEAMREVADRPRELWIRSRVHEDNKVLVSVQDNGVGLKAEMLERVFEAFHTTKPEGLGIGLSISRSIIEAHSGQLWPSADDLNGATFQFTLPIEDTDDRGSTELAAGAGLPAREQGVNGGWWS